MLNVVLKSARLYPKHPRWIKRRGIIAPSSEQLPPFLFYLDPAGRVYVLPDTGRRHMFYLSLSGSDGVALLLFLQRCNTEQRERLAPLLCTLLREAETDNTFCAALHVVLHMFAAQLPPPRAGYDFADTDSENQLRKVSLTPCSC